MIVYTDALVSHDRMIADRMAENRNIDGILTNADQGREMMAVVEKEMRSQISLAMLAQSNMVRGGLLSLVAPR
jgi:flagellin-like hook-associated protein FlgL